MSKLRNKTQHEERVEKINTDIRSNRYTCSWANTKKLEQIDEIFKEVLDIKKQCSKIIHNNIHEALTNKSQFIKRVSEVKRTNLVFWSVQDIMYSCLSSYEQTYETKIKNYKFRTKIGEKKHTAAKDKYKNGILICKAGEEYTEDIFEMQPFDYFLTYLLHVKNIKTLTPNKIKSEQIKQWFSEFVTSDLIREGLIKIIEDKKIELRESISLKEFTKPTFRVPNWYGKGKDICYFKFDKTNNYLKHWFRLNINKSLTIWLPINYNSKFHNWDKINQCQSFIIKLSEEKQNSIDIINSFETEPLEFKAFNKVIGIDVNAKHNLFALSDNSIVDYDHNLIDNFFSELEILDNKKKLSKKDKKHYANLTRQNESYFKWLISKTLDRLESQGITDIVMEDLEPLSSSRVSNSEFDERYTRLCRVLRHGSQKDWFKKQAEKRGIRVHLTQAEFSSQQCSHCGVIRKTNRETQEDYKCSHCKSEFNADFNAAKNLEFRYTNVLLRSKLHLMDKYQRFVPNPRINFLEIKEILVKDFKH